MKIENAIRSDFEAQLPSTGELFKKYEIFERFLGSLFINDWKSTVQKYFRNNKINLSLLQDCKNFDAEFKFFFIFELLNFSKWF